MINYEKNIKDMNVWEKVAQISGEIEYIQKDSMVQTAKGVGYKAVSIEKVMSAVSKKMSSYGLVIYPVSEIYDRKDEEVVRKDGLKVMNRFVSVQATYKVVNIHDPKESFEVVSIGEGVDTQDKAVMKAQTFAYKNLILKLFNIPVGNEDGDRIHSEAYTETILNDTNEPLDSKVNPVEPKVEPKVEQKPAQVSNTDDIEQTKLKLKSDLIKQLTVDRKYAGDPVNPKRLFAIYGKLKDLQWNKKDFNNFLFATMGISHERDILEGQYNAILEYLDKHLKLINK